MDLHSAVVDIKPAPSPVGEPHAYACVLHGACDSRIWTALIDILHCFQRLRKACGFIHDLAVGKLLPRTDSVPVTDLPGRDPHHARHLRKKHLHRKTGLGHAESAESSRRRIIGIVRLAVNVKILIVIGTGGMGAGSLQHRTAQRSIRPCIGNHSGFDPLYNAVLITAHGEFHIHGMTFGMDQDTLRPGKLHLHRALCKIGDHGRVMLHGHILFSSETAAHQLVADFHLLCGKAQEHHAFMLGIVNALIG